MFKKIIALCLSALLLCSISTTAFGTDTPVSTALTFEEAIPKEVQERMAAQTPALETYFELMEFFEKDEFGVPIYPDHYAGEYIDENNKLVVQFTEKFSDKKVLSYIASSPLIQTKYVERSYNELAAQKKVADELISSGLRVVSHGVDIVNNKYEIELLKDDLSKASTTYAKNSLVSFKEGESSQAMAQLKGGDKIYNEDHGGFMSIGICGTYNSRNVLLTCGHGNIRPSSYSSPYPYVKDSANAYRIGHVVYAQANTDPQNNGTTRLGDFAIVEITSTDTPTNLVNIGGPITGTYSSLPVGTSVYKFGSRTGYAWGTVTAAGVNSTYDSVDYIYPQTTYIVNGLYRIQLQNATNTNAINVGDSGGPVWRTDNGQNFIHGIVTSGNFSANVMCSTPIYYAQNRGFSPKLS